MKTITLDKTFRRKGHVAAFLWIPCPHCDEQISIGPLWVGDKSTCEVVINRLFRGSLEFWLQVNKCPDCKKEIDMLNFAVWGEICFSEGNNYKEAVEIADSYHEIVC